MIRYVLLDVDDTLLDFRACARVCADAALRDQGHTLSPEALDDFMQTFHTVNDSLWHRMEKGEITREGIFARRFPKILEAAELPGNRRRMERIFRRELQVAAVPVDGAMELLEYLHARYPLYVASNATYAQQHGRLEAAGMRRYIREIFASAQVGASKPDPQFFRQCLKGMADEGMTEAGEKVAPEDVVMIGDSLHADIEGAAAFGMHTIWLNRAVGEAGRAEWTVKALGEFKNIL